MLKLWSGWSKAESDDRDHVCSMEHVRSYCVDWCLEHDAEFERLAPFAMSFPNGNLKQCELAYKKHVKLQQVDPSVELSGLVDVANLPAKSSARWLAHREQGLTTCRRQTSAQKSAELVHVLQTKLQAAWVGDGADGAVLESKRAFDVL